MSDSINEKQQRHRARMVRKKAVMTARVEAACVEKGVLLVHTGLGKGKSTAAFGMLARALGHQMRVAVVQFIKHSRDTGEEAFFRQQENVQWCVMGEGFSWDVQDKMRDQAAAQLAWQQAQQFLVNSEIGLVVLDELCIALKNGLLEIEPILMGLKNRAPMQHVVVTGRGAPLALIDLADTVTDMNLLKHAFGSGIRAMKGVEF